MSQQTPVLFHSHKRGTHAAFSNWAYAPFHLNGVAYVSTEQYMMAEKARLFGDAESEAAIMALNAPHAGTDWEAWDAQCKATKARGRDVKGFVKDKWDAECRGIMVRGIVAKFEQNTEFRDLLIRTGDAPIAEASPHDSIWGIGMGATDEGAENPEQWRGTNFLGAALMQARAQLAK